MAVGPGFETTLRFPDRIFSDRLTSGCLKKRDRSSLCPAPTSVVGPFELSYSALTGSGYACGIIARMSWQVVWAETRNYRLDLYAFLALLLGALTFSHSLGYWPYGVSSQAPATNSTGLMAASRGSILDLLGLPGLPFLLVIVIFYRARSRDYADRLDSLDTSIAAANGRIDAVNISENDLWQIVEKRLSELEKCTSTEVATNTKVNDLATKLAGSISWQERMRRSKVQPITRREWASRTTAR